jgi:hypothetical protein
MRRNHFDAQRTQLRIERIAVVGLVADEKPRQLLYEPLLERVDDELLLIALTTRNPDGDRKAMAVCHCHDLGRLAAASVSNLKTPLFAPAWVPSTNASVRSISPRSRRSFARARRILSKTPSRSHF